MLKLYHAGGSVCSIKVRIGLAEKKLDWDSCLIDLQKGEQFSPEYLRLNPNGVVPTLDHDGFIVIESTIILQYIDALNGDTPLMPIEIKARTSTLLWLLRCIDIHAAINTMTFSTVGRQQIMKMKTVQDIEDSIKKMPNPGAAAKRRDLIKNGMASSYLAGGFYTLYRMFADMRKALDQNEWITGAAYGLADTALTAYIDRLDRLGFSGLWEGDFQEVGEWLDACRARPSYALATDAFINPAEAGKTRTTGEKIWPEVKKKWDVLVRDGA
jgi:glutathione S-transferase